jgi:hypothetical protein
MWVMRAAFGRPVVPLVKMKSAVSAAVSPSRRARSGRSCEQLRSACVRSCWLPPCATWPLPSAQACMACVTRPLAASNAGKVSSSTSRCAAPETFRQCASASPVSWLLMSAVTTPTLESPNQIGRYSSRFGIISATTSPRRRPAFSAQWA